VKAVGSSRIEMVNPKLQPHKHANDIYEEHYTMNSFQHIHKVIFAKRNLSLLGKRHAQA